LALIQTFSTDKDFLKMMRNGSIHALVWFGLVWLVFDGVAVFTAPRLVDGAKILQLQY
jgi:hypothetical protein